MSKIPPSKQVFMESYPPSETHSSSTTRLENCQQFDICLQYGPVCSTHRNLLQIANFRGYEVLYTTRCQGKRIRNRRKGTGRRWQTLGVEFSQYQWIDTGGEDRVGTPSKGTWTGETYTVGEVCVVLWRGIWGDSKGGAGRPKKG